jgi:hypothetical protein
MATRNSFPSSPKTDSLNPGRTRRDLFKLGGMIAGATGVASVLRFDTQAWAMKGSSPQKVEKGSRDDRIEEAYDIRVDAAKLELEQGSVAHPPTRTKPNFRTALRTSPRAFRMTNSAKPMCRPTRTT